MKGLVFWQDAPSLHQSALMRKLGSIIGGEVVLVTEQGLEKSRSDLGWSMPDFGDCTVVTAPTKGDIRDLRRRYHRNFVHIVSGLFAYRLTSQALLYCTRTRQQVGLMIESPDIRGKRGELRRLKYWILSTWPNRVLDFSLVAGGKGNRFFRSVGWREEKIFPWAYFLEQPSGREIPEEAGPADAIRLFFVGSYYKGLDLLLYALAGLQQFAWSLDVVGGGPERNRLVALAANLGLAPRIHWRGVLKNHETRRLLENADLLAVPSRHDGWGAVVNEALMAGVPVVVSDACGASVVVHSNHYGRVFRSGHLGDLQSALTDALALGKLGAQKRAKIRQWADCLSGTRGALYLRAILAHVYEQAPRPRPPWEVQHSDAASLSPEARGSSH